MRTLAILGASGHGKVVADCALLSNWDEVIFYDDAWPDLTSLESWPVVGATEQLIYDARHGTEAVVAIGNPAARASKLAILRKAGLNIATVSHPSAALSRYAHLGSGCVIVAGAVVNAFARVGDNCIINTSATIGHDCRIADNVHIAPGANVAGSVTVGELSWLGIGCVIRQGITIGSRVTVGAGAVVITNVADGETVVGMPAKSLR